jgi:hypothetical protein
MAMAIKPRWSSALAGSASNSVVAFMEILLYRAMVLIARAEA